MPTKHIGTRGNNPVSTPTKINGVKIQAFPQNGTVIKSADVIQQQSQMMRVKTLMVFAVQYPEQQVSHSLSSVPMKSLSKPSSHSRLSSQGTLFAVNTWQVIEVMMKGRLQILWNKRGTRSSKGSLDIVGLFWSYYCECTEIGSWMVVHNVRVLHVTYVRESHLVDHHTFST